MCNIILEKLYVLYKRRCHDLQNFYEEKLDVLNSLYKIHSLMSNKMF